jgi:hypothetical protein
VFLFGYRPRSIVGSGYSRSISVGGSWRPYLLVFRVWLIRSLTPPKTELPATIANRRPKVEKYRGKFIHELHHDELHNCYFRQDGATAHTAPIMLYYLRTFYDDRLINSSRTDHVCPLGSPDLTPLYTGSPRTGGPK